MRSPSIEWLHAKLEKSIRLAQSYTEIDKLEFIIKACRLKPYDYIFDEKSNKIVLYKWWFDEFGNSLKIVKNKRIVITHNDLKLDRKKIISTDLYYGLSLENIAKMSKMVFICCGKDEDLYQECCLISFLGLDNHIRSYLYWYGEWQQVSPLLLGMKWLKYMGSNLDIKYFLHLENKENWPIPCVSGQAWLSCLPASAEFISQLSKQNETISSIFKR